MHQGTSNQIMQHTVPRTLTHIQAKEAVIEAIAELTCALDKKHTVPRTLTHIQTEEADIEAIDELTCALDKGVAAQLVARLPAILL
ncbi:hypothetical protein Tco_0323668 [Tanacetum coccineum]